MDPGVALGITGVALAFVVPLALDWLKQPRVRIVASTYRASQPVPWTFAAVKVKNEPLRFLGRLVSQGSAQGALAYAEFRRVGEDQLCIPTVPLGWSSKPEPLSIHPVTQPSGDIALVQRFAPEMLTERLRSDIASALPALELAVAILRQGDSNAFGFGAESYAHHQMQKPEWRLQRGNYAVDIRVEFGGGHAVGKFSLAFLSDDFAQFDLTPR